MLSDEGNGALELLHCGVRSPCKDQIFPCCPPCSRDVGLIIIRGKQGSVDVHTEFRRCRPLIPGDVSQVHHDTGARW